MSQIRFAFDVMLIRFGSIRRRLVTLDSIPKRIWPVSILTENSRFAQLLANPILLGVRSFSGGRIEARCQVQHFRVAAEIRAASIRVGGDETQGAADAATYRGRQGGRSHRYRRSSWGLRQAPSPGVSHVMLHYFKTHILSMSLFNNE